MSTAEGFKKFDQIIQTSQTRAKPRPAQEPCAPDRPLAKCRPAKAYINKIETAKAMAAAYIP
jgi:hypothetical protein